MAAAILVGLAFAAPAFAQKPNIVYIVADDLGWKDVGYHVVDMYPTLLGLAGGSSARAETLDGLNVWPAIAEGQPSPRTEVVYNIEVFRAGLRQGDWKLVWRAPIPSAPELYNIAQDPSEKTDLAAQHPEKVAALQTRVNELAATMAKSPLLQIEFDALRKRLAMPPALPGEEFQFSAVPEAAASVPVKKISK